MKLIYYNVSGVNMEILQFLLSFFLNEYGGKLSPIIELLKNNDFDIKKTLQNVNLETIAPLIKNFMENGTKNRPENSERSVAGLNPIAKIADKDIVYTLNKYFYDQN